MKPYEPKQLPLLHLDYELLFPLAGKANKQLALYDGLLQGIVNPAVLLSPLTNEESVLSSQIEGTNATINEVLEQEAGLDKKGKKYGDIQEIINYRTALQFAKRQLEKQPITLSLILGLHKVLLTGARGQDKTPGEFRKTQNWIGKPGCPIEKASFVPPNPLRLQDHLEAWQKYVEADGIEPLLQTALVHAQFELIHPFKDGNGRIGRLLIPLFLYQKKHLSQPMFYLSAFLEANREEYYLRLQNISRQGDWNGWIAFFFKAVAEQAKNNSQKVQKISELHSKMLQQVQEITHSQYTNSLVDAIFSSPIFNTAEFISRTKIHRLTALRLLNKLKAHKILMELRSGKGRRPAILWFPQLLNIVK